MDCSTRAGCTVRGGAEAGPIVRGEREEKPLTLEARLLWGLGIREEGLHFPVVFWVRVVPGVPGFGAGVILTKRQAAERVTLIEDEKRVLHSGSVWGGNAQPCWTHSLHPPTAVGGGDPSMLAGAPV